MNELITMNKKDLSGCEYFEKDQKRKIDLNNQTSQSVSQSVFATIRQSIYQSFHKFLGIVVLPAQILHYPHKLLEMGRKYLVESLKGELVVFRTKDQVILKGMYFKSEADSKNGKTIIFFNANGMRYELYGTVPQINNDMPGITLNLESFIKKGFNVFVFNYRGIDNRTWATRDGLVLDGEAAFEHIKEKYALTDNQIILYGHSLGGGIASEVAAQHVEVNYCNDRSFFSLYKAVKVLLGNGKIGRSAGKILNYSGWIFDSRTNWEKIKGKKFAIYSENDSVIKQGARFHEGLNNSYLKLFPFICKKKLSRFDHMRGYCHEELNVICHHFVGSC